MDARDTFSGLSSSDTIRGLIGSDAEDQKKYNQWFNQRMCDPLERIDKKTPNQKCKCHPLFLAIGSSGIISLGLKRSRLQLRTTANEQTQSMVFIKSLQVVRVL
ncbi:hypothetical protein Bpfe_021573 [Biomphalaria pfeifferi]|uniref:Uncharacterized protein n=1 Tax=Biomphalaria pfeifferi TaxID=112525 RepID=A0AAD8B6K6_BIOPF|nr:hypothetical protein Bpfe_021573 [Biomphalaria pfeifferi]